MVWRRTRGSRREAVAIGRPHVARERAVAIAAASYGSAGRTRMTIDSESIENIRTGVSCLKGPRQPRSTLLRCDDTKRQGSTRDRVRGRSLRESPSRRRFCHPAACVRDQLAARRAGCAGRLSVRVVDFVDPAPAGWSFLRGGRYRVCIQANAGETWTRQLWAEQEPPPYLQVFNRLPAVFAVVERDPSSPHSDGRPNLGRLCRR